MSEIIVQKFGGTSVGSDERINAVANIIKNATKENKVIVVVSAMSGETNRLIKLAKSFSDNPNRREFDALISTGEKVSASLLAMALEANGVKAKSFSASQISMKTTNHHSKARIVDVDGKKILSSFLRYFFNVSSEKYFEQNFVCDEGITKCCKSSSVNSSFLAIRSSTSLGIIKI